MKNETEQKKKFSLLPVFAVALMIGAAVSADTESAELFVGLVSIVVFLLPILIFWVIARSFQKKKSDVHTHDRIDHKSDLKINPATGKATSVPVKNHQPHSAKEHWQQQLDALLANGTIDKAEYREMMKRKF